MTQRRPSLSRIAVGLAGVVGFVGLLTSSSGGAVQQEEPPPYTGSASASGVSITVRVPGFPATDSPVDAGGPTAQVSADSLGTSMGYAAFPNPGELVISGPGLLTGLLGGGAGGLPPIPLPAAPSYPLYVQSDAATNPDATAGAGPYELKANSVVHHSTAFATGGLQTSAFGNAALVTSSATAEATEDGAVFTARTNLEAITIGPLTIGQVTSVATERLSADGTVEPSTQLEVAGLKIAGIPIGFTMDALKVANQVIPLPINSSLASFLAASSLNVEVLTEQRFENRVVAPALRITMPLDVPGVGTAVGSMTIIVGAATASATGVLPGAPDDTSVGIDLGATDGTASVGSGNVGALPDLGGADLSPTAPPSGEALTPTAPTAAVGDPELLGLFDIRSLYLMLVVGALATWLLGQFVRLVGVRSPWTSTAG